MAAYKEDILECHSRETVNSAAFGHVIDGRPTFINSSFKWAKDRTVMEAK